MMKNFVRAVSHLLILSLACGAANHTQAASRASVPHNASAQDEDLRARLVGVWQASDVMAAGWNEAYQFFADGRFVHHTSQMDCETRERSRRGRWRVSEGRLLLYVGARTVIEGGRLVSGAEMSPGCASRYEIVGGVSREQRDESRVRRGRIGGPPIGEITRDELGRLTALIGRTRFWKYNDDPSGYN